MSLRTAIGYAALIMLVAVGLYGFVTLPDSIPTSFGSDGTPSAWGPKGTILVLPGLGLFTFVLISILQAVKPRANLPFRVTDEQEAAIQATVYAGMADLKVVLMCGFLADVVVLVASSRGTLSPAFIPVTIAFVVAVLSIVASIVIRAWRVAYS